MATNQLNSFLDVGYVTPAGQDVFPTTGPHLDVRVLKDGEYLDPKINRALLSNLKIGKTRTPLWQQKEGNWISNFPVTSEFGPRTAPTAGASTMHLGQDYGIPANTPLTWEGPGSFTPGAGYGTIKTTDPQGNPYEIRLLHTKGGKKIASSIPSQQATSQQNLTNNQEDLIGLLANNRLLLETLKQQRQESAALNEAAAIQKQKNNFFQSQISAQENALSPGKAFLSSFLQPVDYLSS